MQRGAKFSPDRIYRYRLWRIWDNRKGIVLFIGLNPSTADENINDPTIRRCIGFAMGWGYSGMFMGNIFAFRNTYPEILKICNVDPLGAENDKELRAMNSEALQTVLCWGNDGLYKGRGDIVVNMFPDAYSFGYTKQGQPKHPLYLPKNAILVHT
ncbi:hypothetical protein LCGC14_0627860 [marine sediment metagenome]|uniref:DUF1643 domain-containing protein n=1 Tax=marine sediment metagenome TaxID=412755 RepID=A0A0F9TPA6_9ZZZZ